MQLWEPVKRSIQNSSYNHNRFRLFVDAKQREGLKATPECVSRGAVFTENKIFPFVHLLIIASFAPLRYHLTACYVYPSLYLSAFIVSLCAQIPPYHNPLCLIQ